MYPPLGKHLSRELTDALVDDGSGDYAIKTSLNQPAYNADMLVYGLISPHPPIIIPAIGKDDTKQVQQTIAALELASERLGETHPDELVIISPHEGHGFEVPLYYLAQHVPAETRVEQILVTEPSYEYYYKLGQSRAAHIASDQTRTAIVASGDLSHVLKADGPYGYDPAGPALDELIVQAVQHHDDQALLNIDPATLEQGAECGLRSILFLLGALASPDFEPNVLSYEGPFGVGYLVATYGPKGVSS
jgi:aromatic ring-opening dioxygenase LigB subunit